MVQPLSDQLNLVLDRFEANVAHVEATAIFNTDGLVIASRLPSSVDEERIGAMSAAILSISNRSIDELSRGTMKQILVEGNDGSLLIRSVGEDAVLVAMVGSQIKLGMLFYECTRCVKKIGEIFER